MLLLLMSEDITQGERLQTMRRDSSAAKSHEMRTPDGGRFPGNRHRRVDDLEKEDIAHYLSASPTSRQDACSADPGPG